MLNRNCDIRELLKGGEAPAQPPPEFVKAIAARKAPRTPSPATLELEEAKQRSAEYQLLNEGPSMHSQTPPVQLSDRLATLAQQLLVVIPARYASVRFPGKPLALIHGKPMVLHTLQRAQESLLGQHCPIVVATEDERIASVVRQAGGTVMMTSDQHHSGTDRVWEVAQAYPNHPYVLNLQGDEPMMPSTCLEALLESLARWQNVADVLTLVTPLAAPNASVAELEAHWADPAQVKAILASSGQALYFTRALAPHIREERLAVLSNLEERAKLPLYRHLGLYLYKRSVLEAFVKAPPSPLELMERLEQLRGLEMGFSFYAGIVPSAPTGVDTPSDLEQIAQLATAMGLG